VYQKYYVDEPILQATKMGFKKKNIYIFTNIKGKKLMTIICLIWDYLRRLLPLKPVDGSKLQNVVSDLELLRLALKDCRL
jgi:hypothetical protein